LQQGPNVEENDLENVLDFREDKLLEKFQFRLDCLDAKVLDVAGEPLVQPQVGPPGRGHEIS
jgi:hypothetical protein